MVPRATCIRKPCVGPPHGLADREIKVVPGQGSLPATHPDLEKTGIDIDQRRSAKLIDQMGRGKILEVQQQVSVRDIIETQYFRRHPVRQRFTGPGPQRQVAGQTVRRQSPFQ